MPLPSAHPRALAMKLTTFVWRSFSSSAASFCSSLSTSGGSTKASSRHSSAPSDEDKDRSEQARGDRVVEFRGGSATVACRLGCCWPRVHSQSQTQGRIGRHSQRSATAAQQRLPAFMSSFAATGNSCRYARYTCRGLAGSLKARQPAAVAAKHALPPAAHQVMETRKNPAVTEPARSQMAASLALP